MRPVIIALVLLCAPLLVLADVSSTHFKVLSPVIGAPGGTGSSTSYSLSGTVGEVAHGAPTSTSYRVNLGFFSFPTVTAPIASALAGNASQRVDLSWSAAVPYLGYTVAQYDIGYSTVSGGPYTYIVAGNVLAYNVGSLTNNTPYYFVIRALDNASIPIATSSQVSATPVSPSLTFTVDSGTQSFPALTPGQLVATSSILNVLTANVSGFVVTAARQNGSGTLTLNGDTGVVIPDKTAWTAPGATTSPGTATASTTEPQTLQFRVLKALTDTANYASAWWGSADTDAGALFAGLPTSAQTIVNRSTPAPSLSAMRVLYNVNVPQSQKTGTYQGDVVYSASANP